MKIKNTFVRLFVFLPVILIMSCSELSRSIYVSENGDDSAKGSKDSPFKTLYRAKAEVGRLIDKGYTGTVEVILEDGVYMLNKPLRFSPEDVGDGKLKIVFRAAPGSHPLITGAGAVKSIKVKEGLWYFDLPEDSSEPYDIYVNSRRAVRARTPNNGFVKINGVDEKIVVKGDGRIPEKTLLAISLPGEMINQLKHLKPDELKKVRFTAFHKWDNTIRYVDSIDTTHNIIYSEGRGMKPWNPLKKGTRLLFENYKNALDTCGEWFQDGNTIYYKPFPGEQADSSVIYIPVLSKLLIIEGDPDKQKIVRNIGFVGLHFGFSSCELPENGFEPSQAAASTGAAVMIEGAKNITFTDCKISGTGEYAVWFGKGCSDCLMKKCEISDCGAGGIRIGETVFREDVSEQTGNIVIDNCIVHSGGYNFPCAVGVWIGQSGNNTITHCDIGDFRYTGISAGWKWGYGESLSQNNTITFNHIHHIGWALLSDMSGIYTLGISNGTVISNNIIHDIHSYGYGGWGIYPDEGSSYIRFENNIVYNTKTGGFHQHYGKENVVRNNVFAFAQKYQLQATRVEKHRSFVFKNNIVIGDKGVLLKGPWTKLDILMDSNCYWYLDNKPFDFCGLTFEEWKDSTGHDLHSLIEYPGHLDKAGGTFTPAGAVAAKTGFNPFGDEKAGVYGEKEWVERAVLPHSLVLMFDKEVNENIKAGL